MNLRGIVCERRYRRTASELPLRGIFRLLGDSVKTQEAYCTKCCTKTTLVFARVL